jgi:hypothetical protein
MSITCTSSLYRINVNTLRFRMIVHIYVAVLEGFSAKVQGEH